MDNDSLLIVAMAEQCRSLIGKWERPNPRLPAALQPRHLLWMCEQIDQHADEGPPTKLHRWIGFIQCAMLAHRMLDLEGAKAMFDNAKVAHGRGSDDLVDHLDPTNSFEAEIGGEG
jgi:hypothetical protein